MTDLKFKVKVIALSLIGNKIAYVGDKVKQSQLASDVNVLLDGDYIEHTKESKKAFDAMEKAAEESSDEPKELTDMTVAELKAYAIEKELDVDLGLNKADILAAIIEAEKTE